MTISSIIISVSIRSAFFIDEMSYDIFLPQFKKIVEYSHKLLTLQSSSAPSSSSTPSSVESGDEHESRNAQPTLLFAFDIGVIPALYSVIVKCRDPFVRREALGLLERYPRREGVWDSVATAGLGKWVIGLEEGAVCSPAALSCSYPDLTPTSNSPDAHPSEEESSTQDLWTRSEDGHGLTNMIPETKRVRKTRMRFNLLERRANMFCFQIDERTGLYVERTEVSTW